MKNYTVYMKAKWINDVHIKRGWNPLHHLFFQNSLLTEIYILKKILTVFKRTVKFHLKE